MFLFKAAHSLDPLEEFGDFVTENPQENAKIIAKAEDLEIRTDKVATILAQTLFDTNILKQIAPRVSLLKHFLKTEKDQKGFLGGLERLIGLLHPAELMAKTPLILKAFYDADLLEEEIILSWGEKVSKKYVDKKVGKEIHAKAEPFLKWLQEAEEEESSEDDEE